MGVMCIEPNQKDIKKSPFLKHSILVDERREREREREREYVVM